jgi:hypothetical protein
MIRRWIFRRFSAPCRNSICLASLPDFPNPFFAHASPGVISRDPAKAFQPPFRTLFLQVKQLLFLFGNSNSAIMKILFGNLLGFQHASRAVAAMRVVAQSVFFIVKGCPVWNGCTIYSRDLQR